MLGVLAIELDGQTIEITFSDCYYGGKWMWFICPDCQKRVGKLFRKPLGLQFSCRLCSNLTYLSTRLRRSFIEEDIKLMKRLISI